MGPKRTKLAIRQVLVALDASSHSLAALRLAIELAAQANAELLGLFVEDTRLLHLAKSPHARRVLYPSAKQQPLNGAGMEEMLRAQAEQARQALLSLAGHAQVRWSFRVVRGEVTTEVLAAASDADVLVLGRTGWSLAQQLRLGSTALAATRKAPRALLLVPCGVQFRRQVFVLDDGSHHSLASGAQLAAAYGNRLVVLIAADEAFDSISQEACRWLKSEWTQLHLEFRRLPSADVLSIAHAVQLEGGGILVTEDGQTGMVNELSRHLDSPILLVRQPHA